MKKKLEYAAYTENVNFFEELNSSALEGNTNGEVLKEIIQRRRESRFAYVRLGSRKARKMGEAIREENDNGNDSYELENRKGAREDEENGYQGQEEPEVGRIERNSWFRRS